MHGLQDGALVGSGYSANRLETLSQDQSTLPIQQHFTILKNMLNITTEDLLSLATNCGVLDQTDCEAINATHSTVRMGKLWKKIIRKGKENYYSVISRLIKRDSQIADLIANNQVLEARKSTTNVLLKTIQHHKVLICYELDLSRGVSDMLYQFGVITIDEHDEIDDLRLKGKKREKLMNILLSKDSTEWIPWFIHILHLTKHTQLANDLKSFQNSHGEERVVDYPDSPVSTIEMRLSGHDHCPDLFRRVEGDKYSIQQVFKQMVDNETIKLREGSIVFSVRTRNPAKLMSILKGSNMKMTRDFLRRLFKSSRHLVNYFPNNSTVTMSTEEIVFPQKAETRQNDICVECFRETVRENYKDILAEIEDDIINETLDNTMGKKEDDDSREHIRRTNSRSMKVVLFLQYVFDHVDILLEFKTIFEKKSQLELKQSRCQICSQKPAIVTDIGKNKIEFTICTNEGNLVIKIGTPQTRPISDYGTSLSKDVYLTIVRPVVLRDLPVSSTERHADYRILVLDKTNEKANQQFINLVQESCKPVFQFCQLPRKVEDEVSRKRMTRCIVSSSPGPHAFVLLIDISDLPYLPSTISSYQEMFGPNFTEYLVVGVKAGEKTHALVEEYFESFMQCRLIFKGENRWFLYDNLLYADGQALRQVRTMLRILINLIKNECYFTNKLFNSLENAIIKKEKDIKGERQNEFQAVRGEIKQLNDKLEVLKDNSMKVPTRYTATQKVLSQGKQLENEVLDVLSPKAWNKDITRNNDFTCLN